METENNKKLGFMSIVFLGINSIVGSGIFLLPNEAYAKVGNASLVIMIINAILALSIALCFAECASRFDKNGSAFVYVKAAFGDFAAFEVGLFTWFIGCVTWAAETQGLITVLASVFPIFKEPFINRVTVILIAVGLAFINYLGIKFSKFLNNTVTVCKLIPLIFFILIGIFFIKGQNFTPLVSGIKEGLFNGNYGNTSLIIFYAFTGFDLLAVAAEEMDNPQKNLPRALMTVISFVSFFYLLGKNLAFSSVPIASATAVFLGNAGFLFVTIATLISIGGITIALSFIAPQSAQALAENKYLPSFLNKKSQFGTPGWAILITTIIVICLANSGNFIYLASLTVIARLIEYIPTIIAVLVLRKKNKTPALYTVPGGIIIPLFAFLISCWLLFNASWDKLLFGASGLLFGALIYMFYVRKNLSN
jgi:amino acid transporter